MTNTDTSDTCQYTQTDTEQSTDTQPTQPTGIVTTSQTIIETGLKINNEQTKIPDTNVTTHTTFDTTDPNAAPQIKEDLTEKIEYNYDDNIITESDNLVNEIRHYAEQIKCQDFHGKGNIDDYAELFKAAAKIANETKQMQLDIDIDGFDDFGKAADELSELFSNFTKRLQNINIINDVSFLQSVLNALKKFGIYQRFLVNLKIQL
jgi:flagellin-specific chaperone FliS